MIEVKELTIKENYKFINDFCKKYDYKGLKEPNYKAKNLFIDLKNSYKIFCINDDFIYTFNGKFNNIITGINFIGNVKSIGLACWPIMFKLAILQQDIDFVRWYTITKYRFYLLKRLEIKIINKKNQFFELPIYQSHKNREIIENWFNKYKDKVIFIFK